MKKKSFLITVLVCLMIGGLSACCGKKQVLVPAPIPTAQTQTLSQSEQAQAPAGESAALARRASIK